MLRYSHSFNVSENINYETSCFHTRKDRKLLKCLDQNSIDIVRSLYNQASSIEGTDEAFDVTIEQEDSEEDRIVVADQWSEAVVYAEALISHFNTWISLENKTLLGFKLNERENKVSALKKKGEKLQ